MTYGFSRGSGGVDLGTLAKEPSGQMKAEGPLSSNHKSKPARMKQNIWALDCFMLAARRCGRAVAAVPRRHDMRNCSSHMGGV